MLKLNFSGAGTQCSQWKPEGAVDEVSEDDFTKCISTVASLLFGLDLKPLQKLCPSTLVSDQDMLLFPPGIMFSLGVLLDGIFLIDLQYDHLLQHYCDTNVDESCNRCTIRLSIDL